MRAVAIALFIDQSTILITSILCDPKRHYRYQTLQVFNTFNMPIFVPRTTPYASKIIFKLYKINKINKIVRRHHMDPLNAYFTDLDEENLIKSETLQCLISR